MRGDSPPLGFLTSVRPRYFVAGAVTLTSTSVFFVPPPRKPLRHAKTAAMTTIKKITTMATTPVLPEPSPSAIVFKSSSKLFPSNAPRGAKSEVKSSKTKQRKESSATHTFDNSTTAVALKESKEKGVPQWESRQ